MSWRRSVLVSLPLVVSLLCVAGRVSAQTSTLTFNASPDHSLQAQGVNIVDRYELTVTPQLGPAPASLNLQKPTPSNNVISVNVTTYLNGLPPGTYTAVVKAIGPGGEGASPASAPFELTVPAPRAPASPPVIIKGS